MRALLYQGHASFRLVSKCGTVVYIDPYAGEGYELPADIILVSHFHPDHSMVEKCTLKENGLILTPKELLVNGEYQTVEAGGLVIRAVPAYNEKHSRNDTVGFLIRDDDILCYIAADTSKIPEMEELKKENVTYAMLPCDGYFNMGADEAAECAEIIGAKYAVPVHTCKNTEGIYSEENAKRFKCKNRLLIKPGEYIYKEQ